MQDYLRVLRRRKWIILQAVVLVPLAAVAFSLHQAKLYQASAQVLLSSQDLASQLTGTQSAAINLQTPDRIAQTQADVARVPAIASRVLRHVRRTGLSAEQLLGDSSVSTATNADILTFSVVYNDPATASRLVDAYAAAYTVYRRQLDTTAIVHARAGVEQRIRQLDRARSRGSALYASLVGRDQTLATMEALQTSNATVVQPAEGAVQVQPKTSRNGMLGLFLGIVLGVGLAFLWEALDTRVRTAQAIGELLGGLPLLARLPTPSKKLRSENKLVMLEEPSGVQAETFRMLRTNLDFVTLDRGARTLMVTSAVEREGKSTTIANLGIALARAGQRVALVDLDLRRPILDKMFNLHGPGVTQVALGHATLDQALARVAITEPDRQRERHGGYRKGNDNGDGQASPKPIKGVLEVLPSGPIPPDPGEFVGTQTLADILKQLRDRVDIVLIDAPPVLSVGDAMSLSRKVDGIIVVTRMKIVRRHMLAELGRQLATVPTPVLGFVVTGSGEEEGYGSGYTYGYGHYAKPYEQSEKAPERHLSPS